jgi:tetraacyldisaccharide 4'-kinase
VRGPLLQAVYHRLTRARVDWIVRRPELRRALGRPVISVGNIGFGGTGKTPLVGEIAAMLCTMGERPAILSRGYGRRSPEPGVVLVRDATRILADVDRAGDEPLMLARALPGTVVAVGADRYLAGRLAELHAGATIHLLDDGFQHVILARDIDLLVLDGREPTGRVPLREDLSAAARADAILLAEEAGIDPPSSMRIFRWKRELDAPRTINGWDEAAPEGPVVALAGIGAPDVFFDQLRRADIDVRRTLPYRDHHRFTTRDLREIAGVVRTTGCRTVLTTEKDAMRLRPFRPLPFHVLSVPLKIRIHPADEFRAWISDRVAYARTRRREA